MDKRILLLIFFGMFLVVCSYGVSAAIGSVNITSPANYSNYSTWMWVNVTYSNATGITDPANATFYYNDSGTTWASIGNISCGMSTTATYGECNGTLSITAVPDGIYTINATLRNSSDYLHANISAFMVTIDNTAPNVSSFLNVGGLRYNDTLVLNVSSNDSLLGVDSVYFNLTNASNQQELFKLATLSGYTYSLTWNITNLTDGNYTVVAHINDSYVNNTNTSASIVIQVDQDTPPDVTNFVNTVDYGNYTTATPLILNVSVVDAEVSSVYFNITYWNGTQMNWTKASNPGGNYYNMTLSIGAYVDGLYNVTVYANDTLNNKNWTESIRFRVDTTAPSVSVTSRSAYTKTSLTLAATATDATNITSCTITDRTGATPTHTGAGTWTITETGLSCSTSYTYTLRCTDGVGYSTSATSYTTTTDACAGGNSVGGGTTASTWTHTYNVNDAQFGAGYNKEIGAKERMIVKVGTRTHTVGVVSLTSTTANIEVSSDPVMITLDIGGEAKIDLSDDGFYDIQIWLLGIANNKADIKVLKINQEVPEGGESVSTTGEVTPIGEEEEETTPIGEEEEEIERNLTWLWLVIGAIIVIAAFVIAGIRAKKKK